MRRTGLTPARLQPPLRGVADLRLNPKPLFKNQFRTLANTNDAERTRYASPAVARVMHMPPPAADTNESDPSRLAVPIYGTRTSRLSLRRGRPRCLVFLFFLFSLSSSAPTVNVSHLQSVSFRAH